MIQEDFAKLEAYVMSLPEDDMALQFLDPTPLILNAEGVLIPEDLYQRRAANMFHVDYNEVTEEQRQFAKRSTYFLAYTPRASQ